MTERKPPGTPSSEPIGIANALMHVGSELAHLHSKVDRIAYHLTRLMLHLTAPSPTPAQPEQKAVPLHGLIQPVLTWLAERTVPILLGYLSPIIIGALLLSWKHVTGWVQTILTWLH